MDCDTGHLPYTAQLNSAQRACNRWLERTGQWSMATLAIGDPVQSPDQGTSLKGSPIVPLAPAHQHDQHVCDALFKWHILFVTYTHTSCDGANLAMVLTSHIRCYGKLHRMTMPLVAQAVQRAIPC